MSKLRLEGAKMLSAQQLRVSGHLMPPKF